MLFTDALNLASREITPEGYLKAIATITCVGIQDYLGSELQEFVKEPLKPNQIYSVYRSPEVVFAGKTIASAALKPITDGHPYTNVSSENYQQLSVGTLGENRVTIDSTRLAFSILITDKNAVEKVQRGTHELSSGYSTSIAIKKGLYNGKSYDMVFDSPMMINHIALEASGRCGTDVRILDTKSEIKTMPNKPNPKLADLDTGMLMEKLSEKLLPDLQKLVSGDAFLNMLATKMSSQMSESINNAPADAGETETTDVDPGDQVQIEPENDPAVNGTLPAEEVADVKDRAAKKLGAKLQDAVTKEATKRLKVLEVAKLLDADFEFKGETSKQILQSVLKKYIGDKDYTKKLSEDYLRGLAHALADRRATGSQYLEKINMSASNKVLEDDGAMAMATDAMSIRKLAGERQ